MPETNVLEAPQRSPLYKLPGQTNGIPEPAGNEPGAQQPAKTVPAPTFLKQRLLSLDAYRGLIMITLAFNGFGLARTATNHLNPKMGGDPDSTFWQNVHYQFEHVQWTGCGYWDLIQPSFMFMVGVAMAYSYGKRKQNGESWWKMFFHAVSRSVILIFLGIFLISNWQSTTTWSFMNVLTQIGLGYTFLFLLWNRPFWLQAIAAVALLAGTWGLYVNYPDAGIDPNRGAPEMKISQEWAQRELAHLDPAWHKDANVGHAIDLVILNWLPRSEPFEYNSGGYQTINFIPSLVTMLFGLMVGELLRTNRGDRQKLSILISCGLAGLAVGLLLEMTGVCPLVKRIWTPSWAIFSTGWCLLILATLYAIIDMFHYRRWAFPLIVVGVNSIAIYCMSQLLKPWAERTLTTHFGSGIFTVLGPMYQPMVLYTLIGLVFWLMCFWMYRQKMFVRI
jgi:heparan-alpha-glucosaminide N-acetyltransferase